eukprot:scpid42468/ scgid11328/ 
MRLKALLLASIVVLAVAQSEDEVSRPNPAQLEDSEDNAIVQKHHLAEHTKLHNPCAFRHCTSRQVCKVVTNPALQFPVAHCEDAFSLAGTDSATTSPPSSTISCEDAELSTDPMSCRDQSDWELQARTHCGPAAMKSFKVQTECLSFDPTPVYQFANFQCCSKKVAPPSLPSKPAAKKPLSPPKKEETKSTNKPTPQATELNTSPPVTTTPAAQATPQPATVPEEDEPKTRPPAPANQEQKPVLPQVPSPVQEKPAKSVPPKATTSGEDQPKAKPPPPQHPKDTMAAKKPVKVEQIPAVPMEDVEAHPADHAHHDKGDEVSDHWFAVMAIGGTVVLAVVIVIVIVVRMNRKQQVLHKPRHLLIDASGTALGYARKHGSASDEDAAWPGADGLVFDDTEVQNFVNPVAMYSNAGAHVDDGDDRAAIIEPSEVAHWEMEYAALLTGTEQVNPDKKK